MLTLTFMAAFYCVLAIVAMLLEKLAQIDVPRHALHHLLFDLATVFLIARVAIWGFGL